MSGENNFSLDGLLNLVAACCVASAGLLMVFRVTQSDELKVLREEQPETNFTENDLTQEQAITKAMSTFATFLEDVNHDKKIIMDTLKSYNAEAKSLIHQQNQITQNGEQSRQPLLTFSYFQASQNNMELLRAQHHNQQMLGEFETLMQTYPQSALGKSPKLEDVESAARILDEHHDKVLNLVKVLFTDLFSVLQTVKSSNGESQRSRKI